MRLIDADTLIGELQKDEAKFDKEAEDAQNDPSYTECYRVAMWSRANGIRDAIIEVYDAPTIDAVNVVYGEWIKRHGTINCSVCKRSNWSACFEDMVRSFNFCPNCGAKMKGADDETEIS